MEDMHATTNIFYIHKDGIFLGVDSRTTVPTYNPGEYIISDDNFLKYRELVTGVGTTPAVGIIRAGSCCRMKGIWKYCKTLVKSGVTGIYEIAESVYSFMKIPPAGGENRGCSEFFLAGFHVYPNNDEEEYQGEFVVFYLKDGVPEKDGFPEQGCKMIAFRGEGNFGAIGSGAHLEE